MGTIQCWYNNHSPQCPFSVKSFLVLMGYDDCILTLVGQFHGVIYVVKQVRSVFEYYNKTRSNLNMTYSMHGRWPMVNGQGHAWSCVVLYIPISPGIPNITNL